MRLEILEALIYSLVYERKKETFLEMWSELWTEHGLRWVHVLMSESVKQHYERVMLGAFLHNGREGRVVEICFEIESEGGLGALIALSLLVKRIKQHGQFFVLVLQCFSELIFMELNMLPDLMGYFLEIWYFLLYFLELVGSVSCWHHIRASGTQRPLF